MGPLRKAMLTNAFASRATLGSIVILISLFNIELNWCMNWDYLLLRSASDLPQRPIHAADRELFRVEVASCPY